jgi:hypothetical protein
VDDHLGPDRLGERHPRVQERLAARPDDRRLLEILRPQPDDHLSAAAPGDRGRKRRRRQLEPRRAEARDHAAVRALQPGPNEVHRRGADEPGHEQVGRPLVQPLRRVQLDDPPVAHHGDAVAHRHRLDLVVRDVHRRRPEPLLELLDLGTHLDAQLGVEVRERLVHQERSRLAHDRAAHRHPLALAARKLAGLSLEQVRQSENLGRRRDALRDFALLHVPQPQPEADVLADGHVRVQRVALEDHRDVAVHRVEIVDDAAADPDLAVGELLQARRQAEHRCLAGARRPDEHDELPVRDLEVHAVDGRRAAREDLGHAAENDLCHRYLPFVCRAIRSRYQSALRLGTLRWSSKFTATIPNRLV